MKIAILSDIHGNLPALETSSEHIEKWQPDLVVVAGDIVNRGPSSAECLHFVMDKKQTAAWHIIHGNHEGYILERHANPKEQTQFTQLSYWTYQQLKSQIADISQLPLHLNFVAPDASQIRITHASMRGDRDGIYPEATDEDICQQIAPAPAVFCTAHIHRPFCRPVNGTLIVNAGSVGSPCDGDVRASYAQVEWGNGRYQANIIRLDYDREQAKRDYITSGYFDEVGPFGRIIYEEWLTAQYRVYPWFAQYWDAIKNNEIDMETAVSQFLDQTTG